ncbi:hypothetical protein H0H87_011290 [Tephrocybe sp. NHM501043]|nr:hypothetical protein H0H87_011290 [Tephrocybe sp. NHM501043]
MIPIAPSIDVNNPFYCPAVPATSYIKSLQNQVRRKTRSKVQSRRNNRLVVSFARVLKNALLTDAFDSSDDENYDAAACINLHLSANHASPTSSSSSDDGNPMSATIPLWEHEDEQDSWEEVFVVPKKRKRANFSDICGPPKYARSVLSAHDSSFDVSVKRETLCYSDGPASPLEPKPLFPAASQESASALELRVRDLEERLFGPAIGTESPCDIHAFIDRLDDMLPGIRLKERLSQLSVISHQSIIDFLGANGMDMRDHANTARTLAVFNQPNSFLFVSELSLRDIHVHNFNFTHIHHLPRLATLLLDNTSISNEAIFLLLPLKHTLTQLSIGSNPAINDDAVPALLLLSKLSFLSILDTGILMPGIRRLAHTIYIEERAIDIEIPSACEEYIEALDKKYELDPRPPLITAPEHSLTTTLQGVQMESGKRPGTMC